MLGEYTQLAHQHATKPMNQVELSKAGSSNILPKLVAIFFAATILVCSAAYIVLHDKSNVKKMEPIVMLFTVLSFLCCFNGLYLLAKNSHALFQVNNEEAPLLGNSSDNKPTNGL